MASIRGQWHRNQHPGERGGPQEVCRLLARSAQQEGCRSQAGLRGGVVHLARSGTLCDVADGGLGTGVPDLVRQDELGKVARGRDPQWESGKFVSANWGGSTLAPLATSQHPKEAAELAMWLTTNKEATTLYTTKQFLFPVLKDL